jgi:hypothetical protein
MFKAPRLYLLLKRRLLVALNIVLQHWTSSSLMYGSSPL